MSSGSQNRTRSDRAASLPMPPGRFERLVSLVRESQLWACVGIAIMAAIIILVICRCWEPPFPYRTGQIPPREMFSRVQFEVPNDAQTQLARDLKRKATVCFYANREAGLQQLREKLRDQLFVLLESPSFDQLSPEAKVIWPEFYEGDETASPEKSAPAVFSTVKATFSEDAELQRLDEVISFAMGPLTKTGLLLGLEHEEGDAGSIRVYSPNSPDEVEVVSVEDVRIAQASLGLRQRVVDEFKLRYKFEKAEETAELIASWVAEKLPTTLFYDEQRSEQARIDEAASVPDVLTTYYAGRTSLAEAGKPLSPEKIDLLRAEWSALHQLQPVSDALLRFCGFMGMIASLYLLCGTYIYFAHDRALLTEPSQLSKLLGLVTVTIVACWFASAEEYRGEITPLVLAAITATVAYGRQLALIVLSAVCLALTLLIGHDLAAFVGLAAASLSCILLLGRIRSRTRLITVGFAASAVTAATVIGVGIVDGPTHGVPEGTASLESVADLVGIGVVMQQRCSEAIWAAALVVVASLLMTGLLPFVEKIFAVQTDLSLLELGDPSHALLRELAQRAPGTYNHSINVASIAEAAGEAIAVNGLLLRVGAYYHDIGKIFKPDYFVENQGAGPNQHDALVPAMSTLVIIAHVKDGANLARSHRLPEPMIDFILQHHGTTLVEYFYREAKERSGDNPNKEEVKDQDFRYPGPKPQSIESAILMLADGVESASRALVDPTPKRIQSLVEEITMKRLTDGQFDECGITLSQLGRIKQSLVKSVTAIYHGRIKYPGPNTA